MQYSKIRDELKTGDIVLFSGKGAFSDLIKYASMSRWSHVGMVVKIPEYDFVTVWESTTLSNIKDLDTGNANKGVQLVPLSARVDKYSGGMSIRRLEGSDLGSAALSKLMTLRAELKGKRYERGKMELFKSLWDGKFGLNEKDLSSIFCSELVAEAYQCLGLLDTDLPSNEYTPADFSSKKMDELRNGFYLGGEIEIT